MTLFRPKPALILAVMVMLSVSACISIPLTLPTLPPLQEPSLAPSLQPQPTFDSPPRDSTLTWTDELSEKYCHFSSPGRLSSLVQSEGVFYAVRSSDARSVWRYQPGEAEGEKIAESMTEDGKFIEKLRVNDGWLVMLIFDHPLHIQGWRIEALNLVTREQQRVIDNILAAEDVIYLDMELQGDLLYFLTRTVGNEQSQKHSEIRVFNLADGSEKLLLTSEPDLLFNQLAISEKYLMISQSANGEDLAADFPILFYNLQSGNFEDLMEISGSLPMIKGALAAWSEQGPKRFPETIKIFDFASGLSWPMAIKSAQPSDFYLSDEYLVWVDPSEPATTFPAVYLSSLDDGHTLTLITGSQERLPQFPQVWDGGLSFGMVKDPYSASASSLICTIPLSALQQLAAPVQ